MVDVVRVKPPEQVRAAVSQGGDLAGFESCNLKEKSRCRPAAGSAGCHIIDNHKSQVRQASIRSETKMDVPRLRPPERPTGASRPGVAMATRHPPELLWCAHRGDRDGRLLLVDSLQK